MLYLIVVCRYQYTDYMYDYKNNTINNELLPQHSKQNQHSMEVNTTKMHDIAHLCKIAKPLCNWIWFQGWMIFPLKILIEICRSHIFLGHRCLLRYYTYILILTNMACLMIWNCDMFNRLQCWSFFIRSHCVEEWVHICLNYIYEQAGRGRK